MRWFKNLKKWQQGGLIGSAVGLLFTSIMALSIVLGILLDSWRVSNVGSWIIELHAFLFAIFYHMLPLFLVAIVVCYGGFGAIVGRVQQMANPVWKWLLTGLLALFLLFFYWFNFQVAMWLEHL